MGRPARPAGGGVATDVRSHVVPGSGHWLMEEAPKITIPALLDFLR
jgi:pimeloyl-ACP methyl ester carboxylesterase